MADLGAAMRTRARVLSMCALSTNCGHLCAYCCYFSVCRSSLCRYNRRRQDFDTQREYDNYLEEIEDIGAFHVISASPSESFRGTETKTCTASFAVFCLVERTDIKGAESRIAIYQAWMQRPVHALWSRAANFCGSAGSQPGQHRFQSRPPGAIPWKYPRLPLLR